MLPGGGKLPCHPGDYLVQARLHQPTTIQASGTSQDRDTPSEIDLSHVTTLTGTDRRCLLQCLLGRRDRPQQSGLEPFRTATISQVSGAGSVLNLSSLPSIVSDQDNDSLLSADPPARFCFPAGTCESLAGGCKRDKRGHDPGRHLATPPRGAAYRATARSGERGQRGRDRSGQQRYRPF